MEIVQILDLNVVLSQPNDDPGYAKGLNHFILQFNWLDCTFISNLSRYQSLQTSPSYGITKSQNMLSYKVNIFLESFYNLTDRIGSD